VQGQSIALKPLGETRLNPLGVVVAFKADEEIIGLADEGRRATQARLDLPFEPHVEHVVQVDVAQQWGEHAMDTEGNLRRSQGCLMGCPAGGPHDRPQSVTQRLGWSGGS